MFSCKTPLFFKDYYSDLIPTPLEYIVYMIILKEPGNYLKNQLRIKLVLVILCIASISIILLSSSKFFPFYIDAGDYEGVRSLLMVFPLFLGMHWWQQFKYLKSGFDGERQVTKKLKSVLSDQFFLINDVTPHATYTNIDHVLLSPKDIFVIETKNYKGTFRGRRQAINRWIWEKNKHVMSTIV